VAAVIDTLILRTRPSVVEAKRVSEDDREELARWCGGWTYGVHAVRWFSRDTGTVLEAEVGDWIVRSAFGHFVRVSDSALAAEYDRVTPAVAE
jgi:hypothetical protein